jgi:hypothetical protein
MPVGTVIKLMSVTSAEFIDRLSSESDYDEDMLYDESEDSLPPLGLEGNSNEESEDESLSLLLLLGGWYFESSELLSS